MWIFLFVAAFLAACLYDVVYRGRAKLHGMSQRIKVSYRADDWYDTVSEDGTRTSSHLGSCIGLALNEHTKDEIVQLYWTLIEGAENQTMPAGAATVARRLREEATGDGARRYAVMDDAMFEVA